FEWCLANSLALQAALMNYTGQIEYHLPSHPLCKLGSQIRTGQKQLSQKEPVADPTVYTDGSGKAAVVWYDDHQWQHIVEQQEGSPQIVELCAVTLAFQRFTRAVNIVTDSAYVAGLVQRLDKALLGKVSNALLFGVFQSLWLTIQKRSQPYYVLHIKSHTTLPGFLAAGNAQADQLVSAAAMGPVPNMMQQAIESHRFLHQGFHALKPQFHLTTTEAQSIVAACPDCQGEHVPAYYG
ncbi:POK19 protein, partial [Ceuthmochares aereus]|nr:POK19 protein [Ceuthmochares aereus]